MIIGICGKSGSGKTTIANELVSIYGNKAIHLDIDKIGHKVLTIDEVQYELIKEFGYEVVKSHKVDRKKLGELVFNSREKMDNLTEITWKHMEKEIDEFLSKNKEKIIILDWILLPVTKYLKQCDIKILLDTPYEIRKERTIKRDGITSEAFDLREKASLTYNKNHFDYIIKDNHKENIKRLVKLYD